MSSILYLHFQRPTIPWMIPFGMMRVQLVSLYNTYTIDRSADKELKAWPYFLFWVSLHRLSGLPKLLQELLCMCLTARMANSCARTPCSRIYFMGGLCGFEYLLGQIQFSLLRLVKLPTNLSLLANFIPMLRFGTGVNYKNGRLASISPHIESWTRDFQCTRKSVVKCQLSNVVHHELTLGFSGPVLCVYEPFFFFIHNIGHFIDDFLTHFKTLFLNKTGYSRFSKDGRK